MEFGKKNNLSKMSNIQPFACKGCVGSCVGTCSGGCDGTCKDGCYRGCRSTCVGGSKK